MGGDDEANYENRDILANYEGASAAVDYSEEATSEEEATSDEDDKAVVAHSAEHGGDIIGRLHCKHRYSLIPF